MAPSKGDVGVLTEAGTSEAHSPTIILSINQLSAHSPVYLKAIAVVVFGSVN
ncbi:MAG: hypothetical protein P8M51_02180 [Flavobacteriaceae bacterium]|nr:hypothetical protein [Flavobacteriaceae bacterium]